MKETPSFNLALLNLFIGMVSGNRLLHPVSQKVCGLGYRLHSIEPSFESSSHMVNPEALACSEQQGHTLLVEWTQADKPDDRKRQQIIRYTKVQSDDLVNKAAVPPKASKASGTWLVVHPQASDDYEALVDSCGNGRLMLCTFSVNVSHGFSIKHKAGELHDKQLSSILQDGIEGRRIPMGFVRVSMENLNCEEFVEQIIQQIIVFTVKDHLLFSAEDIAKAIFGMWRALSPERKQSVTRAVSGIVKEFHGKGYAGNLLQRTRQSPPEWRIACADHGGQSTVARRLKESGNKYLLKYNPRRPVQFGLPHMEIEEG